MDRITELQVFAAIAEEANLTRASEVLGLSVSGVSRTLSALETRLGVRLVQRTTRQMSLTSEGESFARNAREILNSLREAEESVIRGAAEPFGTLRIGASLSFALLHLMPVIQTYKARYPLVRIEIQASNRYCDIIENGLDLAIRTRRAEADSSVTIRKLAEVPRMLAAAPGYIARYGTPEHPDDLRKHKLLLYSLAEDWDVLTLTKAGTTSRLNVSGDLVANDGQLLRDAALGGMGILVQPAYIIYDDLRAGRLLPVLPDWTPCGLTMNLAYPTRSFLPMRARLFIDALVGHFRENGFESLWAEQFVGSKPVFEADPELFTVVATPEQARKAVLQKSQ
ncbi:LysR family transcriptional regulator [Pseudotabrizicola alkalilacus]|uniref:LysR family transcriptional regulator n=1 Tax=Pseudotabrizicola alkalilacus TaxID=2305252 RepID=A0A411Z2X7_9RHOB|nr:LysR family transcriptional regulator [Pseudotabrizicola alkalilacus]RGP37431.1 LysR family transcriptional regulator [Pseudotabrizicola alkalilacus]